MSWSSAYGDEIPTKAIGDKIMLHLRRLDEVAYVRFASVLPEVPGHQGICERSPKLKPGGLDSYDRATPTSPACDLEE